MGFGPQMARPNPSDPDQQLQPISDEELARVLETLKTYLSS